jgi:hypothetical protein
MPKQITTVVYLNIHGHVVIEIRENDKILAWAGMTPEQALGFGNQIVSLAKVGEQKDVTKLQ